MRLLYLYPEEWTGQRAREVHTLSTCAALARSGLDVTLVTAGGLGELHEHLKEITGAVELSGLNLVVLSRTLGPIRSATIFKRRFHQWRRTQPRFDWAYIIHLKAAAMLVHEHVMPYLYEAHEIFAQSPRLSTKKQIRLHELERKVLIDATLRVATSRPLAEALSDWFALPDQFVIAPNAGQPPLDHGVGDPEGPFIYCGSIADWKGLDLLIEAARDAKVPLKIVGGTRADWRKLGDQVETRNVAWHPRVPLTEIPLALAGARAGVIPTQPESASGRYSCPMKIFDYARCGLPVVSTALPSLQSLDAGSWCTQVPASTVPAWTAALRDFRHDRHAAESARAWAGEHTWARRAAILRKALGT